MIEECRGCKFYDMQGQYETGADTDQELHRDDFEAECRRYPPVRKEMEIFRTENMSEYFSGPTVRATGWCGEWRKRQQ